jgi:hypothetical protein
MDKETSGDHSMIREWFENSRFSTCEASNVFEALEQLSDFTIKNRPDVVLVDVDSCEDEMPILKHVSDLPSMAISGKNKTLAQTSTGKYFHSNFGFVASQLDRLIPH